MTRTAADSTGLILLAKTGLLALLCERDQVLVAAAVFQEVCSPSALERHPDAELIRRMADDRKLHVTRVAVTESLVGSPGLGYGEREALSLVENGAADRILTDDGRVIRYCRRSGYSYLSSPGVVIGLHQAGVVSRSQARDALDRMRILGRYGPDVIARFYLELEHP